MTSSYRKSQARSVRECVEMRQLEVRLCHLGPMLPCALRLARSQLVDEPPHHPPRHPGLSGGHRPHRLSQIGSECRFCQVTKSTLRERVQDVGIGRTLAEQNDPGLRTFLQDGRDQGKTLAYHPTGIEEKNARSQFGCGRHGLEAAPRLAHNFDFFS